jgi:hypothetical protein
MGGAVTAMLEALEHYLGGGDGAERTPAQAYVAGARAGYELACHELGAGGGKPDGVALGFVTTPPLEPPPERPTGLRNTSSGSSLLSLVDPDPRSTAHAMLERGTLELFPAAPAPRARKRRRPFPEEFRVTPELRRFAEAGGLDAAHEFAACRDHYRATGEVRADWPATFREWCRRALVFQERRRRP